MEFLKLGANSLKDFRDNIIYFLLIYFHICLGRFVDILRVKVIGGAPVMTSLFGFLNTQCILTYHLMLSSSSFSFREVMTVGSSSRRVYQYVLYSGRNECLYYCVGLESSTMTAANLIVSFRPFGCRFFPYAAQETLMCLQFARVESASAVVASQRHG